MNGMTEIPTLTFDQMLNQLRRGLDHPNNPAAVFLARAALLAMTDYSETTLLNYEAAEAKIERTNQPEPLGAD